MTEQAENLILEILKNIQGELAGHRKRFEALEAIGRKQRRDTAGLLVIGKSLIGNFTEERAAIEERVSALEGREH